MPSNPICPEAKKVCWCCETGWPRTLYLTLASAACPSLDGLVIPLIATASNDQCNFVHGGNPWVGQLIVGGCNFQISTNLNTNQCFWNLGFGACSGPLAISFATVDCNWMSGSGTTNWFCACCNGNVTATLSL